ncbi:phage portal protein [Bradyrhizobium sp. 179]|uniref:phage portal protein n=1 Tax=Bradyrhizobium sp. 179 TaxID=2782648 RepID=UPI001FFBC0AE
MKLFNFEIRRSEKRASPEDPRVPVSAENFLSYFGVQSGNLPAVTIDSALQVPAVAAAVSFVSASLANLPLHAYRSKEAGAERIKGGIQRLLNESPNPEWTSFGWRKYFWQQVFTGGRGLSWIERVGGNVVGIWPMDPGFTTVQRVDGKKVYKFGGKTYPAADVIDLPFMLRRNQLGVYGPIMLASKAIQLALAMNDYASGFFAGGGVPPLALVGPMPAGVEAVKRAQGDIKRAIDAAKSNSEPVFPIPAGYELKPVGFDPAKGQMTEARQFQVVEIARVYSLPPVFLQDLTHGTFSNTEQQDLHLVKHLIAQWASAFEDEINLKVFGQKSGGRYAEHNLDALMRGDFKSRIDALARGVQTALYTPDEARALDNRPPVKGGDVAYMQGATVPLGTVPVTTAPADKSGDNGDDNEPGTTGDDEPA